MAYLLNGIHEVGVRLPLAPPLKLLILIHIICAIPGKPK